MFSVHISSYGFTRETDWRARKKRNSNSRLWLEQFLLGSLSNYDGKGSGSVLYCIVLYCKRHLELESALFQTSSLQFYLVQYVKYGRIFSGVNPKSETGKRKSLQSRVHVLHNT